MINAEKYRDKISKITNNGRNFSVNKHSHEIKICCASNCQECLFDISKGFTCSCGMTNWLLSEYKETIKLTRLEYEILKHVQKEGFNFIARNDLNDYGGNLYGDLFIYEIKPIKPYSNVGWCTTGKSYVLYAFSDLFQFVKCEDEEPTSIKDVLDNCEVVDDE